jgi:hypothetical protein
VYVVYPAARSTFQDMTQLTEIHTFHPDTAKAVAESPYRSMLAGNGHRTGWTPALARTLMR